MKGFVVIDVPEDVRQKIIHLRNEVLLWKYKPKEEVILFERTSWWKSECKYNIQIPSHLEVFFDILVISPRYYCFNVSKRGERLGELYHLVIAGNPVYLGEDLVREYNKLVEIRIAI